MTFERLGGLLLMLGLLGCEPERIVVAHPYDADLDEVDSQVDASTDSAVADAAPSMQSNDASLLGDAGGCTENNECPYGWFCSKTRCGNDVRGSCVSFSPNCEPDLSPVCGCDGVTYFNDCLRKQRKVGLAGRGGCSFAAPGCAVFPGSCPSYADCFRVHETDDTKMCNFGAVVLSQCWVTPDICDNRAGGNRFQRCGPSGPEGECMTSCEAIKSGAPVTRAMFCPHGPQGMSLSP